MVPQQLKSFEHTHSFGLEHAKRAEKFTLIVIGITALTMIVEVTTGIIFGSMALLADGVHMGSHTLALGIAAFSYYFTRKNAHDERFSFGTGKVNALGGFTSAVLLVAFAISMVWESGARLFNPVAIQFNQAIWVACAGLAVNLISAWILSRPQAAGRHDHHHHSEHDHPDGHHHHDHNLKAAYLHVIADALTSIFAIAALLAGKLRGLTWMDPLMGIVGAILVSRWAWGLLKDTSAILLDRQAPGQIRHEVRHELEKNGDKISDLHLWSIGQGLYALSISIVTLCPQTPKYYKQMLSSFESIVHMTIEVNGIRNTSL